MKREDRKENIRKTSSVGWKKSLENPRKDTHEDVEQEFHIQQ